jgi:hypothetical protein
LLVDPPGVISIGRGGMAKSIITTKLGTNEEKKRNSMLQVSTWRACDDGLVMII